MKIFAHEVLNLIGEIHAAEPDGTVTILTQDERVRATRVHFTEEGVSGLGTREDPFEFCACDVPPYYGIIELWLMCAPLASSTHKVFFRVNNWLFEVSHGGIIAADGTFAKFF